MTPLLTAGANYVYHMDALRLLRMLPDASVDLICTDPPFNIGKAAWDKWESVTAFTAWLDSHLREFRRVLKLNGSLYLFCATKYGADVEMAVRKHFNVLNDIRWKKPPFSTKAEMFDKETIRAFFPASESIIFAEQYGSDAISPMGNAIREARIKAGLRGTDVDIALGYVRTKDATRGTELCRRWEEGSSIPSEHDFIRAMQHCGKDGNYTDLRREYEDLRRPFNGSPNLPYTDVWEYPTVNTYPGKHPCEKPLEMMRDIIKISSREDAIVLDPFCGSGSTLVAAKELRRRYIGCDFDAWWVDRTNRRLAMPYTLPMFQEAS